MQKDCHFEDWSSMLDCLGQAGFLGRPKPVIHLYASWSSTQWNCIIASQTPSLKIFARHILYWWQFYNQQNATIHSRRCDSEYDTLNTNANLYLTVSQQTKITENTKVQPPYLITTPCLKKTSHLWLAITLMHMNGFWYLLAEMLPIK